MDKCSVKDCEKNVKARGLCGEHLNKFYNAGYPIGIYYIRFSCSDKFFVAMTVMEGINVSFSKYKNYLVRDYINKPEKENVKLLEYFNVLCNNNSKLTRKEVFDEYVVKDYDIESIGHIFDPLITNEDGSVIFSEDIEDYRSSYKLIMSNNPQIQESIESVKNFWKRRKMMTVKKYKQSDEKNGTDNCLNIYE